MPESETPEQPSSDAAGGEGPAGADPAATEGEKAAAGAAPGEPKAGDGPKDVASKDAVERLRARAERDSPSDTASRAAVDKLKARADREKPKPKTSSRRRRLSEVERKALWHKAVIRKARKLKIMTDILIFLLLALVVGVHFLPFAHFVGPISADDEWEPKTGYELVMDLVTEGRRPHFQTHRDAEGRPVVDRATLRPRRYFERAGEADALAYGLLAVPLGAALLLLLYLLDYLLWMGRVLPGLTVLYGYGAVGYLLAARLPEDATGDALGHHAILAWYLLLIPLFLMGTVSMLRFVVSQRWKRYEFAGRPVPEHLRPAQPAAAEAAGVKKRSPSLSDRLAKTSGAAKRAEAEAEAGGQDEGATPAAAAEDAAPEDGS
jgi:hypothetical protein